MRSDSAIKEIHTQGFRLVITFWKHDGIFYARRWNRDVCKKVTEAYRNKAMLSFTYDAKLRVLSAD